MPARSTVLLTLPEDVRYTLDARIIEAGFGGYRKHAEWLQGQGHTISVSALQRYGQTLHREVSPAISRVRKSCARAALLRAKCSEHGIELPEAISILLQEELHQASLDGAEADRLVALQAAARALHTTVRTQQVVSAERRAAEAEAAAAAKSEASQRRGLSAQGAAAIRAAVEGRAE